MSRHSASMKIFVLIAALLIVSVQGQDVYQWSGSIRDLVSKAKLLKEDVTQMTRRIFSGMTWNCGGTVGLPSQYDLPSPNQACDVDILRQMRQDMIKPVSFNAERFLSLFWSSKVGQGLMNEMARKGVTNDVVKQAMRQLWFSEIKKGDTAFNRLFLGTDNLGDENSVKFNSWYTFDLSRRGRQCNIKVHGTSLPVVVGGRCDSQSSQSFFIFPNHPFQDLVIFSLCAWIADADRSATRYCDVFVPGKKELTAIYTLVTYDDSNTLYLANVFPDYTPVL